ncbi:MAG: signal peptidase II [Polaromonas sp. 24-62-144]|nr:MAG: signal peptidase II [Polaromonas sp. 24-62-144]
MAKNNFVKSSGGMLPWLGLALLLVIVDQFTKVLILGYYRLGDASWQRWFFTGIGIAAALFIVWMLKSHAGQRLFSFAMACILGGAVGNVIDRTMHGYVVDFLDFHVAGWHFPAFNVADSAITIGAICLILDELLRVRRAR